MLNSLIFLASARSPLWYWEQCDSAAKVVVIVIITASIWSISTIIGKGFRMGKMNKENAVFERNLQSVMQEKPLSEIDPRRVEAGPTSPYSQLLSAALRARQKNDGKISSTDDIRVIVGQVESALQRTLAKISARYDDGMILLSTCVSGGPFLGLLGTVWGVMVTFGALTEKASIAQLAPGVSGALVATTAGLVLAIPAVFAYNFMLGRVRKMMIEAENFASSIADEIEQDLQKKLREIHNARASENLSARVPENVGQPARERDFSAGGNATLSPSRSAWE